MRSDTASWRTVGSWSPGLSRWDAMATLMLRSSCACSGMASLASTVPIQSHSAMKCHCTSSLLQYKRRYDQWQAYEGHRSAVPGGLEKEPPAPPQDPARVGAGRLRAHSRSRVAGNPPDGVDERSPVRVAPPVVRADCPD